jgi:crossover junction endodeoxyribonuclease RuvC
LRRIKRLTSAPMRADPRAPALSPNARILGLDPGSLLTGFGVVDVSHAKICYVASGAIRTQGDSLAARLQEIFAGVERLVREFKPDEVAIERVFMHRNADSALKLGQARGAALCGTFALQVHVYEYAPREVKLAVVGTGAAQKEQVQMMVKRLLNISGPMVADAADALAIAVCHAHARRLNALATAVGATS